MQSLISFDQLLSAHFSTYVANHDWLASLLIIIGVGFVYIVPLLLVYVWFGLSRKAALKAALTGILAWQGLSKLIAQLVDRTRPSFSQIGTKELVFHRPDTSFPSDHSAFLAAIALTLYLSGYKKLSYAVGIIGILVGIARVGIGVHYPGDILAGWLVGFVTVFLLRFIDQPLDRYLIEPLVTFARKLKL